MRFTAFATDYDGTLAHHGVAAESTLEALRRVRDSGRKLLLVTGRELDDILRVLPAIDLFDLAVVENGAVLYQPSSGDAVQLASPPPDVLFATLSARHIPFSRGRVVASTVEPHDRELLAVIRELGLALEVIFNKGSAMILPPGINKASGLAKAMPRLGLSLEHVVGIGDAENDNDFLHACGLGVAVANALPGLQSAADYVTRGRAGEGVEEFVAEHLLDDCARIVPSPRRRDGAAPNGSG